MEPRFWCAKTAPSEGRDCGNTLRDESTLVPAPNAICVFYTRTPASARTRAALAGVVAHRNRHRAVTHCSSGHTCANLVPCLRPARATLVRFKYLSFNNLCCSAATRSAATDCTEQLIARSFSLRRASSAAACVVWISTLLRHGSAYISALCRSCVLVSSRDSWTAFPSGA